MKFKIWHISDTHGYHKQLKIPDVDIVIHSGDFSNAREVWPNEPEMRDFINWYAAVPIKYKILIAGNHDAYASVQQKAFRQLCKDKNIIYLYNETVEIEGIKIYGSPYTPSYGLWHFQKQRGKLDRTWANIPDDTNILVVHGPPKGVMDASIDRDHQILFCGCSALRGHIFKRLDLDFCLFGHIHNNDDVLNAGIMQLANKKTVFSNGSVVTDRKFGTLSSNGNLLLFNN